MTTPRARRFTVGFLSTSSESAINDFCHRIAAECDIACQLVKLSQQDLQSYDHVTHGQFDAVVLLHSVLQGRNSITDVADARYNKLLPRLKQLYGPGRVGVVVHSLTSITPHSKATLMMIFEKSQPTTFECSNCVIQCNKLDKISDHDINRLVAFLKGALSHPLHHSQPEPSHQTLTASAMGRSTASVTSSEPNSVKHASSYRGPGLSSTTAPEKQMHPRYSSARSCDPPKMSPHAAYTSGASGGFCSSSEDGDSDMYVKKLSSGKLPTDRPSEDFESNLETPHRLHGQDEPNLVPPTMTSEPNRENALVLEPRSRSDDTLVTGSDGFASCGVTDNEPTEPYSDQASLMASSPDIGPSVVLSSRSTPEGLPAQPTSSLPSRESRGDRLEIDKTHPLALLSMPPVSPSQPLLEFLKRLLPRKPILEMQDDSRLHGSWHMFEAIFLDVGIIQESEQGGRRRISHIKEFIMKSRKNMRSDENVAILVNNETRFDTSPPQGRHGQHVTVQDELQPSGARIFLYSLDPDGSVHFDDATIGDIYGWLFKCCHRFKRHIDNQQDPSEMIHNINSRFRDFKNFIVSNLKF